MDAELVDIWQYFMVMMAYPLAILFIFFLIRNLTRHD